MGVATALVAGVAIAAVQSYQQQERERDAVCGMLKHEFGAAPGAFTMVGRLVKSGVKLSDVLAGHTQVDREDYQGKPHGELIISVRAKLYERYAEFPEDNKQARTYAENLGYAICMGM